MGNSLIFHFLYINVLNYCYFHNDVLFNVLKNENKKNVGKIKKNVYKRLLQLW